RSTAYHNTPLIDGVEINRYGAAELWSLKYEAVPEVREWAPGPEADRFCASHAGYRKLRESVTPVRNIVLEHATHALTIVDSFEGTGEHAVEIPLHLAPEVAVDSRDDGAALLSAGGKRFRITWNPAALWTMH